MINDMVSYCDRGVYKVLDIATFESSPSQIITEKSLMEAIDEYFNLDFSQTSILNATYSPKFNAFVLPVFNIEGKRNFVFLRNDTIININKVQGYFSEIDNLTGKKLYLSTELKNLEEDKNLVLIINPDISLLQYLHNLKNEKEFKLNSYPDKVFYFRFLIFKKETCHYDEVNSILSIESTDINLKNALEYLIKEGIILFEKSIIIKVDETNIDNLILSIDTLI